jgi:aldehyde:ferredoxin oxidoreductase
MANPAFRLLRVNLETGEAAWGEAAEGEGRALLGGPSLAARLLYADLTADLDPLSPTAPLAFVTGPLTGTAGPAVGRAAFCAKSPATGLWSESNIGGHIGPELRGAGIDGLILTGRAASPSYLWLHDGRAEVLPADGLWGATDTYETQERIRATHGDRLIRVACIGAGGEAGLPFAGILCDHGRVAGRTGLGAVMGAKNLKAIAVRGRAPIPLADPKRYAEARSAANVALRADTLSRAIRSTGTAGGLEYWSYLASMPVRYYTGGDYGGTAQVSGSAMAETILSGVSTCHGCVIACGRVVRLEDGVERKGPEYETIVGFGPNLGIEDLSAITLLGELSDRYGLDTISLSNTMGLAYFLYQEGILKESDAGGLRLEWGNAAAAERLIHATVRREGLGALVALGSRALADHFGVREMAAQVNGLETAYHDPRGSSGMALVYATSPRGACHNQSDYFMVDTLGHTAETLGITLFDRHAGAEKAANVARHQDWRTVANSLVMCLFANVEPLAVVDLVRHATGHDLGLEDLLLSGERAWNLKRAINIRMGLRRENDRLPKHLLTALREGGSAGYVPPIDEMLEAYYRARGWDPATGRPTRAKLDDLGLEGVAADLWGGEIAA